MTAAGVTRWIRYLSRSWLLIPLGLLEHLWIRVTERIEPEKPCQWLVWLDDDHAEDGSQVRATTAKEAVRVWARDHAPEYGEEICDGQELFVHACREGGKLREADVFKTRIESSGKVHMEAL